MVNEAEVPRGEPCAAQKNPNRPPVFFIIDWKLLLNLSQQNLSRHGASVNGSRAQAQVN